MNTARIFFIVIVIAYSNVTQTVLGQIHKAPDSVKVNLSGRDGVKTPREDVYALSDLTVGQGYNVFTNCDDGEFYLGYQLYYDLADNNTENLWEQEVVLALHKDGVEQWRDTLSNDMGSQTFVSTVFHGEEDDGEAIGITIQCAENYTFSIEALNGTNTPPIDNIYLKQLLFKKDDELFDPTVSFNFDYSEQASNEYYINWGAGSDGTVGYELQWVYIDSLDNFTGSTAQEAFAYKEGTSIHTAANYYNMMGYYPSGTLWFRVRSIGINPDYPNYEIPGEWQYGVTSSLTIANHAVQKNWQVVNTFAEGGKAKHVMRYLDGSLRERQLQTNLNTDETTLVAENLYDFEGRPAVNVLPVPIEETNLRYKHNFNVFDKPGSWNEANKFHYDNRGRINNVLDTISGAAKYYSPNNDVATIHKDYIPDGKGYVYTQTQYKNDNTGRVDKQSGVGATFNIDTGRVTQNYYGGASQSELVRLFGSNVGDASHYRKNAVVDPNGQVSVTYLDQEERTIATALAGETPENLDSLPSLQNGNWSDVTVDISNKKQIEGNKIIHSHQILNTAPNTAYTIRYNLTAMADSSDFGCTTCTYDLEISVTGADGNLLTLPTIPGNESMDDQHYRLYDFSSNSCTTDTTTGDIVIDLVFDEIGEYTIAKTLTASEADLEKMEQMILQEATVQQEIDSIHQAYKLDSTVCDFCQDCDMDSIINNTISEVVEFDCQNIYNRIVEDLKAQNTGDTVYVPTQDEIEAHKLYCQYTFCKKNKRSDSLEVQISRVQDWNEAVQKGYDQLIDIDPFFNDPDLSGYDYKPDMQALLDDIFIANIQYDSDRDGELDGSYELRGPIDEVLNYWNESYYINEYGELDDGGYHVLYWDLLSRWNEFTEEELEQKLAEQRWKLYMGFYTDFKRQIKLSLDEVTSCPSLQESLQQTDELPADEEGITAYGSEMGIYGPVSDQQITIFLHALSESCGVKFSPNDSTDLATHLRAYFDKDTTNMLEIIDMADLGIDPDLNAINAILQQPEYGCGIEQFAVSNPKKCVRDTTIVISSNFQQFQGTQSLAVEPTILSDGAGGEKATLQTASLSTQEEAIKDDSNGHIDSLKFGMGEYLLDSLMEQKQKGMEEEILEQARREGRRFQKRNNMTLKADSLSLIDNQTQIKKVSRRIDRPFQLLHDSQSIEQKEMEINLQREKELRLKRIFEDALYKQNKSNSKLSIQPSLDATTFDVSTQSISTPQDEIEALKNIYDSLNGDNWANNSGWKDANGNFDTVNIANWYGITVNAAGNVVAIELEDNHLDGFLPNSLGEFDQLLTLKIANNKVYQENIIRGPVPTQIGNLSQLTDLKLVGDSISGEIPTAITNLTNLVSLEIRSTVLGGEIPSNIGDLVNLEYLCISHVQMGVRLVYGRGFSSCDIAPPSNIQGTIPTSIGQLTKLKTLILNKNRLTGSFPPEIGNLTQLESIEAYGNLLNGDLPDNLANCTNLNFFGIANGGWTQDPDTGGLINHGGNDMTGTLVGKIPNNLWVLSADENSFEGQLPSNFASDTTQFALSVSNNRLSGDIPTEYLSKSFQTFNIMGNNFSGTIPFTADNLWNYHDFVPDSDPVFDKESCYWDFDNNALTFADLLATYLDIKDVIDFGGMLYAPQDTVDIPKQISASLGSNVILTTDIDRNTTPKSKYQWLKDGVAISPNDTASHSITVNIDSLNDFGTYYYKITNDSLPDLTLTSHIQTIQPAPCDPNRTEQIEALIQLYELTNPGDTTWANSSNWKVGTEFDTANVENWYGVYFNVEGNVYKVAMPDNNLKGDIAQWDKVNSLCQLEELTLTNDSIYGDIHSWDITGLQNLETLNLSGNRIHGDIHLWNISLLSNLSTLIIRSNRIGGDISLWDNANIDNLYELNISYNNIGGSISAWNPVSNSLGILSVNSNPISGAIETFDISGAPNLSYINLSSCGGINGDISLWQVSANNLLRSIILQHCNVAGDLTLWNLDSLTNLQYLYLGNNNITGIIEDLVFTNNPNLRYLILQNNNLTGCLANWDINYLTNLEYLSLYGNSFNCDITNWDICGLTSLRYLFLRNCGLTGNIEDWNINCVASIYYLDLGQNLFTGSINLWDVSNLSNLTTLRFDQNQIAGNLDGWNVSGLTSIRNLYGYANQITGQIDSWNVSNNNQLQFLNLSNNLIGGQIDSWQVSNLTSLKSVILQINNIGGDLGQWNISTLINLEVLSIFQNQIGGDVTPWDISTLTKLRTLSAFDNNIGGDITQCGIENLTNLVDLNFNYNKLAGDLSDWQIGNLTKLENFGFDSCRLSGTIDSIGFNNLKSLRSINLTGSKLYGHLDLTGFDNLQNLRLTGNNLSGNLNQIPISMDIVEIDSNAFTFSGLLPYVLNTSASTLSYIPQDSVDVERSVYAQIGNEAILSTDIDTHTVPTRSEFQWYKNGTVFSSSDTANYRFPVNVTDSSDYGLYHYVITNESVPGLTLISRPISLLPDSSFINNYRTIPLCLEYDLQDSSFQANFNIEIDMEEEIQKCLERQQEKLDTIIYHAKEKLIEEKISTIVRNYTTSCLDNVTESLDYTYTNKEYHYTLYYYDQAGNLVQTVPPKGVNPLTNAEVDDFLDGNTTEPAHELATRYKYNSLNQLTWQSSPDGGQTQFWYDKKGQLRLSQNAKQAPVDKYSYTGYDQQGRIIVTGQFNSTYGNLVASDIDNIDEFFNELDSLSRMAQDSSDLILDLASFFTDITFTFYDKPIFDEESDLLEIEQENLRGRVSTVYKIEGLDGIGEEGDQFGPIPNLILYSYDSHGNVKILYELLPTNPFQPKITHYNYDLVSGNVNYVFYEYGKEDQFIHKYTYDADNRITKVETSTDGFVWQTDARYDYYAHGPLARVELGVVNENIDNLSIEHYKSQAMDYYYTLQGWIKGVNTPLENGPQDDGLMASLTGSDEMAFNLGYYDKDYQPIGTGVTTPGSHDALWARYDEHNNTQGLYNGNISWMATQLPEVGRRKENDPQQGYQAMLYNYDQLNRIKASNSLTNYTPGSGFDSRTTGNQPYDSRYSYDPNGNLLTLQRYDTVGELTDDFNYEYYVGTNQLKQVFDNYIEDIPASKVYNQNPLIPDGQKYKYIKVDSGAIVPSGNTVSLEATDSLDIKPGTIIESGATFTAAVVTPDTLDVPAEGQYVYDEIGNLIRDNVEGTTIKWTPEGKVRSVENDNGDIIFFSYDPSGNRVMKLGSVNDSTMFTTYARDASGNVMATYYGGYILGSPEANSEPELKERYIYGSSRVGVKKGNTKPGQLKLGLKRYELTNHLGNVMATITDNISIRNDSISAAVASVSDYYPFGLSMPGRSFSTSSYAYGFNGKEKDDQGEWGSNTHSEDRSLGEGTFYDYGFRIYNPSIGKFLSVDPLSPDYPWYTPYQFAGNKPINSIDLDGLEERQSIAGEFKDGHYLFGTDNAPIQLKSDIDIVIDPIAEAKNGVSIGPDQFNYWRELNQKWAEGDLLYRAGHWPDWLAYQFVNDQYTVATNYLSEAGVLEGPENLEGTGPSPKELQDAMALTWSSVIFGVGPFATQPVTVNNPVPKRLARIIPADIEATTLGVSDDVFVTAAEDIANLSSKEIAKKLTLIDAEGNLVEGPFRVIEFDFVEGTEIATPVFRQNPGFTGGGVTKGGAREFVIPNQSINDLVNKTERIVE